MSESKSTVTERYEYSVQLASGEYIRSGGGGNWQLPRLEYEDDPRAAWTTTSRENAAHIRAKINDSIDQLGCNDFAEVVARKITTITGPFEVSVDQP
jgi:hypothetical protein